MSRRDAQERGFTLLEAIVALVILSGAGMAVFAWINGSLSALHHVEDTNARSQASANVIEYMQAINPMMQPDGRFDFGAYTIQWQSKASTDLVDGSNYPQGVSLYQLALYRTHVQASTSSDPQWFELDLDLVGYKRVRQEFNPLQ